MKKHFTLFGILISFLSFQMAFSQIEDSSFDPAAESVRLAPTPTSPEAQAFTKYGNTPVNMYIGTPNIQIPIYTHKGRELDLPISLTYDASGIKVEQLATNVGLGWNLNVGGRISRITNGMPDDFLLTSHTYGPYKSFWDSEVSSMILGYNGASTNPYFNSKDSVIDYLYFLKKANENEYDIQPDYFSFNALGINDTFVIDISTKEATALNNPRIKISFTKAIGSANTPITKWVVTMDDGTIYTFEETEVTKDTNFNDIGPNTFYGFKKEFNSSWLLTKIESASSKDIYEFTYTDLGFSANRQASSITGVTNVIAVNGGAPNPSPSSTDNMGFNSTEYSIRQKGLTQIKHNGNRIVGVDVDLLYVRWDMTVNSAIEKILIYDDDTNNHTADLYKSYEFEYDYFRTSYAKVPPYDAGNTPSTESIRLKLSKINIKDRNSTLVKNYQFEYIDPYTMSSTTSNSQDYYGYNNGVANSVLYPTSNEPAVPSNTGANRNPNFSQAKKGLLQKITYPTGGHTIFEYEKNYEKEASGTSTVWQTVGTSALTYPTLPSYDATVCNAGFWAGDVTPQTTSTVFEVTQYNTDFKMMYEQTGTMLKGYVQNMASLIKISNLNDTKTWTQIYDNNCGVKTDIDLVWSMDVVWVSGSTPTYPSTSNITLDAGFYQMVLANPSATLSNSLEAIEGAQITNFVYNEKAGVRVKSIKDYTDATTLALHKSYEYPSGTVISMPDYDYYSQQYTVDNNNTPVVSTLLHRLSYASGTDKPHIGYAEVIEKVEDVNGTASNGTTSNRFNTTNAGNYRSGVYTYYINGKETAKNYSVNYRLGKTSGNTVYDSQGLTVSSSSKSYYDLDYYSNTGLYLHTDESKSNLYPIPTYNSTIEKWYINYTPPAGYINGVGGSVGLTPPTACNDTNIFTSIEKIDLCNPGIARLVKRTTNAWARVGNTTQSTSKQYSNNAVDYVNQIIDYTYYDEPYTIQPLPNKPPVTVEPTYLLKETSITNSSEETLKQEFFYPNNTTIGVGSLESNNMLTTLLETKIYKDTVKISEKKTFYLGTLPSKIQTSKGSQDLESRLLFDRYENDNLVQVKQVDGTYTTYIWGYDNRYVVAKIENITYSQIEDISSFGNGFDLGNNGLSSGQEDDIRGLANTLVTTYTYEPVIGVTSITDPNGQTVTFHYDDFSRLEFIKDKDDNILSQNQYNYKN